MSDEDEKVSDAWRFHDANSLRVTASLTGWARALLIEGSRDESIVVTISQAKWLYRLLGEYTGLELEDYIIYNVPVKDRRKERIIK